MTHSLGNNRKSSSSLLDKLLINGAMQTDGLEEKDVVRDLKLYEEAALIVTFAINGKPIPHIKRVVQNAQVTDLTFTLLGFVYIGHDIQDDRLTWRIKTCYHLRRKVWLFIYNHHSYKTTLISCDITCLLVSHSIFMCTVWQHGLLSFFKYFPVPCGRCGMVALIIGTMQMYIPRSKLHICQSWCLLSYSSLLLAFYGLRIYWTLATSIVLVIISTSRFFSLWYSPS